MSSTVCITRMLVLGSLFALTAVSGRADLIFDVSMDTTPLIGHPAGPFALDFQLNDGSATNDGNNTAKLTNFQFGTGGSASGSPALTGGAAGDLASMVSLTDNSFINDFQEGFTPGNQLSFTVDLTTNVDSGSPPDQFTFAILDNSGAQLPTTSFFDVFVSIDINSGSPAIGTFATNSSTPPLAGGPAITMGPPTITFPVAAVPEPGTLPLLSGAAALLFLWRRKARTARYSNYGRITIR